jgi:hypothetical protein
MNKGYGGVQLHLRESMIKDHDGYLGMHRCTFDVGNIQSLNVLPTDDGPFWITKAERERLIVTAKSFLLLLVLKAELGSIGILSDCCNYLPIE